MMVIIETTRLSRPAAGRAGGSIGCRGLLRLPVIGEADRPVVVGRLELGVIGAPLRQQLCRVGKGAQARCPPLQPATHSTSAVGTRSLSSGGASRRPVGFANPTRPSFLPGERSSLVSHGQRKDYCAEYSPEMSLPV